MIFIARYLLVPQRVFLPFLAVGFVMWTFLPAYLMGVGEKSQIGLTGALVILAWYIMVIGAAGAGRLLPIEGRMKNGSETRFNTWLYLAITLLAAAGFIGALGTLGSPGEIITAIRTNQVNVLKDSLYKDYNPGLLTLRYAASVSGAMALLRIFMRRRVAAIDLLNIVFMLGIAFISARLILFQAAFFCTYVFVNHGSNRNRGASRPITILISFFLLFVLVTAFTYLRSANYYRENFGITNPAIVATTELSRYIATPVQVTIGVGQLWVKSDAIDSREKIPLFLAPTFLHDDRLKLDNSGGVGQQWYAPYVNVPAELTTNSAFSSSVGHLGIWSFFGIPALVFFYSCIYYIVSRSRDINCQLYAAVIVYAFFEIWRVLYFTAGSFVFQNVIFGTFLVTLMMLGKFTLHRTGKEASRKATVFSAQPRHL